MWIVSARTRAPYVPAAVYIGFNEQISPEISRMPKEIRVPFALSTLQTR